MEQLGCHVTDFNDVWYLNIFENSVEESRLQLKSDKNNEYFTWKPICTFNRISLVSSCSQKCSRQTLYRNQNTRSVIRNFFFENRSVYEIMWQNFVEPDRPQMTIWCKRISCCVIKATNTHSQYVILIAFPLQQLLHDRAWMLRHTYSAACTASNPISETHIQYLRHTSNIWDTHPISKTRIQYPRHASNIWDTHPISETQSNIWDTRLISETHVQYLRHTSNHEAVRDLYRRNVIVPVVLCGFATWSVTVREGVWEYWAKDGGSDGRFGKTV